MCVGGGQPLKRLQRPNGPVMQTPRYAVEAAQARALEVKKIGGLFLGVPVPWRCGRGACVEGRGPGGAGGSQFFQGGPGDATSSRGRRIPR